MFSVHALLPPLFGGWRMGTSHTRWVGSDLGPSRLPPPTDTAYLVSASGSVPTWDGNLLAAVDRPDSGPSSDIENLLRMVADGG